MRAFRDPATALTAAAGLSAVKSVVSGISANNAAKARARDLEAQAEADALNVAAARSKLQREASAHLARTRAVLAAGSGDTTTGTGLEVLQSQEGDYAVEDTRMARIGEIRQQFFRSAAANERASGRSALFGGLLSGAFEAGVAAYGASGIKFDTGTGVYDLGRLESTTRARSLL
jgi:hypothetical protein